MDNSAKTDNFLKAIKKHAKQQKSQIDSDIRKLKDEKDKQTREKAESDGRELIKERLEKKRAEQTAEVAKKTREGQRELFLERVKMTDEVFKGAEKKLLDYTLTPAYKEKLLKDAEEIAALFEGCGCVLYINEKDMSAAEEIRAKFAGGAEVLSDKTIRLGGIKGYCKAKGIIADETLDRKLDEQREWFIENAELSVI